MLNIAGQKLKTLPPINVFNRLISNKYFFSIFFFFSFPYKRRNTGIHADIAFLNYTHII